MTSSKLTPVVLLCVFLGGCTKKNAAYHQGSEGFPCYPNNTCNSGLECLSGLCVFTGIRDDGSPGDAQSDRYHASRDGAGRDVAPMGEDGSQRHDVAVDAQPASCGSLGYKAFKVGRSSQGDWSVGYEDKASYKTIGVSGGAALEAAATMDYNDTLGQVAGFIVSRASTTTDVSVALSGVIADLGAGVLGTTTVEFYTTQGTTVDGAAVKGALLRLQLPSVSEVGFQRNLLLAAALGKSSLSGLPAPGWGNPTSELLVRVNVILRQSGRQIVVGTVSDLLRDVDVTTGTAIVANDFVTSANIGPRAAQLSDGCEGHTAATGGSAVDIIWVVDESGSMAVRRDVIASNASQFFQQAQANGLDFRMGVTNVCAPNQAGCPMGKFCSVASIDPYHDGGTDRFLSPLERATFEACVRNPPGNESGNEFGLLNATEAVKLHLPRAANQANRIRLGAQLVIITVTDEIPNELTTEINGEEAQCSLSTAAQARVDQAVKGYIDLFAGTVVPDAKVDFYQVIGGVCGSQCGTTIDVAHGYKEVAAALNGRVYDVCQADLGAAITAIINDIKTGIAQVRLNGSPLPISLRLSLNGRSIPRSRQQGFDYLTVSKQIVFTGHSLKQGDQVVVSYRSW